MISDARYHFLLVPNIWVFPELERIFLRMESLI
jgi:hypothetical protein